MDRVIDMEPVPVHALMPRTALTDFLAANRAELVSRLAGMRSFPMRSLGRDDKAARRHEASIAARFAAGDCNLFALSIDPGQYRGRPGRAADEALHRLFILNENVARAEVEAGLGADLARGALASGLIHEVADGLMVSPFRLVPSGSQLFLSERYSQAVDTVYLSYDSLFMARRLIDISADCREHRNVVDLGTGSGILALTAASLLGCAAIGVDLNARALAFAAANAAVNGIEGTWLHAPFEEAPIPDRALVIANPPFVFTPPDAGAPIHSDGGQFGLEPTLRIIARLAGELSFDGSLLMITQSPILAGAAEPRLVEVLREAGHELDLWIENVGRMAPFARYADFYRDAGVTAIEQVVVRARRGPAQIRYQAENRVAAEVCFG